MDNSIDCISYKYNNFEMFLPSPVVFTTFCISHDKTELFIVSLIRFLLYVIVYYLVGSMIDLEKHKVIKYVMLVNISINILYIGMVVSKQTVFHVGSKESAYNLYH